MIKSKLFKITIVLILISANTYSQDTPDSFKDRISYIFANVDNSKVSTGLLSEYGLQIIPPEYYDGVLRDSNEVDINAFKTLYSGIDHSRFNSNCALPAEDVVFNAILQNMPAAGQPIPIASMCISYNCFREDAYTAGMVTVVNDQIFDVAGKNPYQTKSLFAATPLENVFSSSSIQFILKSGLYYSNSGKTIATMEVNMGNGSGFTARSWNVPFTANYSTPGEKTFTIKFTFSDGSVLQTHGRIRVDFTSGGPQNAGGYSTDYEDIIEQTFNQTANHSGGNVKVAFGLGHSDRIIRKPFIVAEGFDTWKILSPDNPHANNDIDDLINYDLGNNTGAIGAPLSAGTNLLNYLYNNGYDIIYLDYNDGTDDIKRNAKLFEEVLYWVNGVKQGDQPNIVMGISMGGLVARYALRQIETSGGEHDTKILLTMDSPHNGANVPAGAQAALYHIKNMSIRYCYPFCMSPIRVDITIKPADFVKDLNRYIAVFNSTAAKQMLIYNVGENSSGDLFFDNTIHSSFMTEYQALGFPAKCHNVTISDGSGSADSIFTPQGKNFVDYSSSTSLGFWLDMVSILVGRGLISRQPALGIVTTLPGSTQLKASITINSISTSPGTIYQGRIYVRKKVLWFIPVNVDITNKSLSSNSTMLPVDGAPGGIYDLDQFVNLDDFPDDIVNSVNQKQFCFVPATSALAFYDWQSYLFSSLNGIDLISSGLVACQEYYKSMPTENRLHTSFYTTDYSLATFVKNILDNTNTYCSSTTTVQNVVFNRNQTYTGCNLTIQNATIQNNSAIVLDPTYTTTIAGPFEVTSGSTLEIK